MIDFKIGDEFDTTDFAKLVIGHACKSDLEIQRSGAMRQTRDGRNRDRKITKKDETDIEFIKGVPDEYYIDLFQSCFKFTKIRKEKMVIDLRHYQTEK